MAMDLEEIKSLYSRLLEYGNLVVIRTDASLRVSGVLGNPQQILGVTSAELRAENVWRRLLPVGQLRRLALILRSAQERPRELHQEVKIIHQQSGQERWLLLRGIPLFSAGNKFLGWEGFGLDITDKHQAQTELISQSKRIEALYEVSRALRVTSDPALVVLLGLKALIKATGSDCGFGAFYDRSASSLEIIAAHGLSQDYLDAFSKRLNSESLVKHVVGTREGLRIDDLQKDPRAAVDLASQEGLRSTIVVPLIFEQRLLGAVTIFCRQASRYAPADFDLVAAAASQIAMSTYQAELHAAERRQAGSLAALYRLSHELSKRLTPSEVAEHALPIIQEELACKRMWFGVLNEQGTHMVGRAGFGPGIRRHLIDMQIDLGEPHDFLDEAIRKKRAVVVPAQAKMRCSSLARVLGKLDLGTFIVVPLVSLGQVVGVLVVEPAVPSAFFAQRRLPLLSSMAGEIATVILARRFETKIAEAHKMKMAGLLASGIAHNFNNLLQAIMGQASLIEMQCQKDPALSSSAKMIIEATNRGAALIRQLFHFSRPENVAPQSISLTKMITDSKELYNSVLGSNITLEFDLDPQVPDTRVDYGQIQQVITNLLMNAREAIGNKEGIVHLRTRSSRLGSGEVHPELAPGTYVRLEIEDNGPGMDVEEQSRCFEPFFTTKNVDSRTGLGFGGSGLGLSSAYSIMRQHDGLITVSSQLGHGSVFSLYLPTLSAAKGRRNESPLDRPIPNTAILGLADGVTFSVRSTLESMGLKSAIMSSASAAEDFSEQQRGLGALLILDADNPSYDVFALVRSLKQLNSELRIVVVTNEQKRWLRLARPLEHVEVLEKPIGVWSIHSVVRKALGLNGSPKLSSQIEVERVATNSPDNHTTKASSENKPWEDFE